MNLYEEKKFMIPELSGISKKQIEEHLKLYAGYVKHSNLLLEKIEELSKDPEKNSLLLGDAYKHFNFEFNGMRNHDFYFSSLLSGKASLPENSHLKKQIEKDFGSFDKWLELFKTIAITRGIGWAILYFDKKENRLTHTWIEEHHLGQLTGCHVVLPLDMWEHAYLFDYTPADKKKYIEAFFENINWNEIEKNFLS